MDRSVPPHERGVALLTVLLIVAVVSVLVAVGIERLNLSIRLAGNAASIAQARSYAVAAEDVALIRLDDVLARERTQANVPGDWNGRSYPVPLPAGTADATIKDGGNCFNLNSLVIDRAGIYQDNLGAMVQFTRLMTLLGISPQDAQGVSAAAADWIDSDTSPNAGGAEDDVYAARSPAYRAANTLMASPSELRAVAGVTPAIYARLRPFICALPVAAAPTLNVNTLTPDQAPLIAMLLPDTLSVAQARGAILARPPQGFESATAFWKFLALSGVTSNVATAATNVSTRWFRLAIEVHMPGGSFTQTSLIDARQAPPARVVARSWGVDP